MEERELWKLQICMKLSLQLDSAKEILGCPQALICGVASVAWDFQAHA